MRRVAALAGIAIGVVVVAWGMVARRLEAAGDANAEVAAFNEKFRAAHERMDTPGILGM